MGCRRLGHLAKIPSWVVVLLASQPFAAGGCLSQKAPPQEGAAIVAAFPRASQWDSLDVQVKVVGSNVELTLKPLCGGAECLAVDLDQIHADASLFVSDKTFELGHFEAGQLRVPVSRLPGEAIQRGGSTIDIGVYVKPKVNSSVIVKASKAELLEAIAEYEWQSVSAEPCASSGQASDCEPARSFADKYPWSSHVVEAKKILRKFLEAESAKNASTTAAAAASDDLAWSQSDWELCKKSKTRDTCQGVFKYLDGHPMGRHAEEGIILVSPIEASEKRQRLASQENEERIRQANLDKQRKAIRARFCSDSDRTNFVAAVRTAGILASSRKSPTRMSVTMARTRSQVCAPGTASRDCNDLYASLAFAIGKGLICGDTKLDVVDVLDPFNDLAAMLDLFDAQ